jgi:VanZ family protein
MEDDRVSDQQDETSATGTTATRRRTWWLALWLLAVLLLFAGSLNRHARPPDVYHLDKLAHLLAYAVLAGVATRARPRLTVWAALLLVAAGGAAEVLQSFVPGRKGSLGDEVANVIGVALGLVAARLVPARLRVWPFRERI